MTTHAQRIRRQQNLDIGYEALDVLAAFDYQITQFDEYHFRINGRLAARIVDLRDAGFEIVGSQVKTRYGRDYVYRLVRGNHAPQSPRESS